MLTKSKGAAPAPATNPRVLAAEAFVADQRQRFAVIREWEKAKAALKKAQAEELNARLLVGETFFTERAKNQTEGSETAMVEGVWKLTWKQPYNYNVDEAALDAVKKALEQRKLDPDEFFRYKPALKMDAYRKADDETLLILADAVESKPGTPQLEIQYAKEKKPADKAGRKGAAKHVHNGGD